MRTRHILCTIQCIRHKKYVTWSHFFSALHQICASTECLGRWEAFGSPVNTLFCAPCRVEAPTSLKFTHQNSQINSNPQLVKGSLSLCLLLEKSGRDGESCLICSEQLAIKTSALHRASPPLPICRLKNSAVLLPTAPFSFVLTAASSPSPSLAEINRRPCCPGGYRAAEMVGMSIAAERKEVSIAIPPLEKVGSL